MTGSRSTHLLLTLAAAIGVACPRPTSAQTAPPALPRFDLAAMAGWTHRKARDLPPTVYHAWDATWTGAAVIGVYWTEHLKTEIEIGTTGERELFGSARLESRADATGWVYQEHRIGSRSLSVTPTYQFLHNTWVHPFVGAGLNVDWERRQTQSEVRLTTTTPGTPIFAIEQHVRVDRAVRLRAAVSTGFKAYVSRRAFIRADARAALAAGLDGTTWRIGAGLDF